MNPLNIGPENRVSSSLDVKEGRFRAMIGAGGIGTGSFFALDGTHTVGREESRSGRFIDRRDYCKLHIVSHYVKALLGPGFSVLPVGKVGNDDTGKRLWEEMEEAGLDLRYVERTADAPTLFSFCFIYPDGSGGNFTTDDSACSRVTPEFVAKAEGAFARYRGAGIALAVPEVPLAARLRLLELGTRYGFFRAASFSSKEVGEILNPEALGMVDLLALNIDEAARAAEAGSANGAAASGGEASGITAVEPTPHAGARTTGAPDSTAGDEQVVDAAVGVFRGLNPGMKVSVTAGSRGSWVWDCRRVTHLPAPKVEAVSTAGAGDAFLAGMVAGAHAGLALPEAQELATLVAALSVTSPHTIHKGIGRESLARFAEQVRVPLEEGALGQRFPGPSVRTLIGL
jgi:ribokinase